MRNGRLVDRQSAAAAPVIPCSLPISRRQVVSDGRFNFMAVAREGRHADFPESGVIAVTQPGPNLEASHDVSLIVSWNIVTVQYR